jgi:hypothetical protein
MAPLAREHMRGDREHPRLDGAPRLVGMARDVDGEQDFLMHIVDVVRVREPAPQIGHHHGT